LIFSVKLLLKLFV